MGCWNATCYISKLPIHAGEKVAVILTRKALAESDDSPHKCYPAESYIPFGYPIFGKYNDYGGIEDIENAEDVLEYLTSVKIYDNDNNIVEITSENLESQVNEILYSNCTVEEEKCHLDGFFVLKDLYELLIEEISSRKLYDKNETVAHQFERLLKTHIKDFRESERYLQRVVSSKACETDKDLITFGMMSFGNLSRFGVLSSFSDMPWDVSSYIKLKLVKKYDSKYARLLTSIIMFKTVLQSLRMGYFCITGDGSQSDEMYMHTLVAKYVIDHASKYYKEACEDSDLNEMNLSEKEFLSETMFGYYEAT